MELPFLGLVGRELRSDPDMRENNLRVLYAKYEKEI
jgi:hypothetical protein